MIYKPKLLCWLDLWTEMGHGEVIPDTSKCDETPRDDMKLMEIDENEEKV